jgi:hypothetical protein
MPLKNSTTIWSGAGALRRQSYVHRKKRDCAFVLILEGRRASFIKSASPEISAVETAKVSEKKKNGKSPLK